MISKQQAKELLKNPHLTGREAARLIIQHIYDHDHGCGDLLSEKQLARLKAHVSRRPPDEVATYNSLVLGYSMVAYSVMESHILALTIVIRLKEMIHNLSCCAWQQAGRLTSDRTRALWKLSDLPPLEDFPIDPELVLQLKEQHKIVQREIRAFLAYKPVLAVFSDLVGVCVHEDLDDYRRSIEEEVERYVEMINLYRRALREGQRAELSAFHVGQLKPDRKRIDYLNERMIMRFGDLWLEHCRARGLLEVTEHEEVTAAD